MIATPLKVWRAFGTGINGHIQNLEALHTKQLDELDELDESDQIAKSNSSKIMEISCGLLNGLLKYKKISNVASASICKLCPACTMLEETPE